MSDEANFQLNSFVNKKNSRVWATEKSRAIHQPELHPFKCIVWCGVFEKIPDPYFFENAVGVTVAINAVQYRRILKIFMWLQDGAISSYSKGDNASVKEDLRRTHYFMQKRF